MILSACSARKGLGCLADCCGFGSKSGLVGKEPHFTSCGLQAEPNGDSRGSDRQATEADSPLAEEQHLRLITVHLAVSPNLNGSLRGVCVDLDIPRIMGDLMGVSTCRSGSGIGCTSLCRCL